MLYKFLLALISFIFATICSAQILNGGSIDEANRLIHNGDCAGVEAYARANFSRPLTYTIFGMSQLDCRHNKKIAIEYFKMAARDGDSVAIEMLVQIGENTSEFRSSQRPSAPSTGPEYIFEEVSPPPPHEFSKLPLPRQRFPLPPVIIVRPLFNSSPCMDDANARTCNQFDR